MTEAVTSEGDESILDRMQMQLAADCLLDRMLCNLLDGEETVRTVQQLMHFIVSDPSLAKAVSRFLEKIKKDPSYLSKCSCFHKRILMFIVVQCILIGEDLNYTYTDENLTPLENALNRLSDIAVAFESEIDDHATFYEIWMQTLKQAVLVLLKNKQTVEASKILVVYRDKIVEDQREVLEKFIQACSKKPSVIEGISGTEGHDYSSYSAFVCQYLKGLNSQLDKTTVYKLVEKICTSLPDAATIGADEEIASSVSSDSVDEDDITVLSSQGSSSILPRRTVSANMDHHRVDSLKEKAAKVPHENEFAGSHDEEDTDSDISSASRLFEKQQQNSASRNKVRPDARHIDEAKTVGSADDLESAQPTRAAGHQNVPQYQEDSDDSIELPQRRATGLGVDPSKMIPINPKDTLAYRLRKRSTPLSGINIPCQHIVSHCRKVNEEEEESEESFQFPEKPKTSSPIKASAKTSKPPTVKARELLLGDRYEAAKQAWPLTSNRNYSTKLKKKGTFNTELDSYIVAGCRHFSVGSWQNILKAFPFPSWVNNMKIKDRFRTLLKWQYVAMLDDGDFSILNNELKERIPVALEKLDLEKVDGTSGRDKARSNGAKHDSRETNPEETRSEPTAHSSSVRRPTKKQTKRKGQSTESDDLTIMSMTSSQSDTSERKKDFTQREDGYLVCGVRYLGFNWLRIKQNFDFSPHVSVAGIKSRWRALVREGKVLMDDEEGEIRCSDSDLQELCVEAETVLKKKVQAQRRSFPTSSAVSDHEEPESDASSDAPEQSRLLRKSQQDDEVVNEMNDEAFANQSRRGVAKIRQETKKQRRRVNVFEDDEVAATGMPSRSPGLKIRTKRHKHTLDSDDESMPTTSTPSKNISMCSDAGTQTKRRKLVLGGPSPAMLDAPSDAEVRDERSPFQVGSPIRRSRIDHFKPGVRKANSVPIGRHKKGRLSPTTQDQRSKRQRELLWKQRRKAPTTKNPWSRAETNQILQGLSEHGPGKWSEILDDGWDVFRDRTSVMIKDKFRSMLQNNQIPEDIVLLCNTKKTAKE